MKHKNGEGCGTMQNFFMLHQMVRRVTTGLWRVN